MQQNSQDTTTTQAKPKKPVFHQSKMRLGAMPAVYDPRTLQFADLIDKKKVSIPESHYWGKGIGERDWGLMRNDELKNCTIASAGHMIMGWNADAGRRVRSQANTTATYIIIGLYTTILATFTGIIIYSVRKIKNGHGG